MGRIWRLMVVALICISSLASAQQVPTDVAFGGEFFFRFRAAAGGLAPEVRANVLQERLTKVFTHLMAQGKSLSVEVRSHGSFKSIWVAGVLFVTVTETDAKANRTNVPSLANIWSRKIDRGLKAILSTGQ